MSNKIVVPTDFTATGDCAINHAVSLAKAGNFEVILLHVLDDADQARIKKNEITEEGLRQKLKVLASDVAEANNIQTDYILRAGTIFETIGQVAREVSCYLVVMGTHGVVGIKQKLFGARAVKVAENTREPMIIVQRKNIADHGYHKIVFPVDHDKNIDDRVEEAITVGRLYNSEIHLLKELETVDELTERINLNYHGACQKLSENGLTCVDGHVDNQILGFGKQIIKYASDVNADLIILKNHSDNKADEFIYGFNEEEIINNDDQIAVLWLN